MPTADEHRAQAAANREFYDFLGGRDSDRPDWALTVLFYAAVHEIAALLADNKGTVVSYRLRWPVETHGDRKIALRAHRPWRPLAVHYGRFFGDSRKTRYECHRPTPDQLDKAEALLERIRSEIARLS